MPSLALTLLPVLGAEASKTPFYIAGGLLALWAVVLSLGIGLRMPDFPRNEAGQRVVIFVSVLLVAGALSTAVLTSGVPANQGGVTAVSASGTASTLTLTADPSGQLHYDKQALKAPAGKVTIQFVNSSPTAHDVTIAQGSSVLGATPVQTGAATLGLDLKAGTYTYYCSVPGHRQAGMQGTLNVS